ncbi:MHS family MFS transporter [Nocardia sp. CA2R105]|uniref:MFS transporter n=1 Tax=Nocardia coffeae TaxID=2873381 RepID=UPI001CA6B4A5|nr:MFS transporter [Nocardia coffeae]MBY8858703.1 MHS family MFS transporter [Nocardia coffeae]
MSINAEDGARGTLVPGDRRPAPERFNRRIAAASLIGTLVEGNDFVLYGLAAALVFPHVFFPSLGETAGTVASLATLGVAFVARPFGSVLFGHFGDKYGRKATLVVTLLSMGVCTTLIGFVPPATQIGATAPICVIVLRVVQGISAGGEWAGSTLFVAEHAPREKRGLYAMFPQIGHALPTAFSSAVFLVIGLMMSESSFNSWGWRVPFVASSLLVGIGLYIRLKLDETPVFKREASRGVSKVPFLEAFKQQPWQIIRGAGVALTTFALTYLASSYLANYGTTVLGFSRTSVLAVTLIAGLVYALATAASALLSDRTGRRRMLGTAHIAGFAWVLVLFPIVNTRSFWAYVLALAVTYLIAGLNYGAVGAFLPEQFRTRYRQTATGISYNLTSVIGGGIVPLMAPIVIDLAGSSAFGILLAVICAIAALCTFSLRETRNVNLDEV